MYAFITDRVAVGSFHGFVRIYGPRPQKIESGGWSGYSPEDLLCEVNFGVPVLQLSIGRFSS